MNKCMLIGNLGRDPEVRYLPNGEAVCNFSVATTERWKDRESGEAREEVTWHRVTAFSRQAEIVGEYLRKGSKVFIEGKMTQRKYTDQSGAEKVSHEIRLLELEMLGERQQGDGESRPQRAPAAAPAQQQQGGYRTSGPRPAPERQARAPAPAPAGGGSGFDDMDDDIPF